jgi:hypothetical protein
MLKAHPEDLPGFKNPAGFCPISSLPQTQRLEFNEPA